jgi:predicted AlkP superfamily phosphohydrolase/phosphomutase
VFLNVAGREPQGVISQVDYEATRDELAEEIQGIRGPDGEDIGTVVYKPETIYREVNGIVPDLIVYFGNLRWRSVGSLGHPEVCTLENDTGPDDANHPQQGILTYYDPRRQLAGHQLTGVEIMDFAPTVLRYLGLPVPQDMQGQLIQFEG